jgi:hypothetical protein
VIDFLLKNRLEGLKCASCEIGYEPISREAVFFLRAAEKVKGISISGHGGVFSPERNLIPEFRGGDASSDLFNNQAADGIAGAK